jgi:N-acetylglucosamine-6-sulfatase
MPVRSHRRIALGALGLLAGATGAVPAAGHAAGDPVHPGEAATPNIILIQTDDQTASQLRSAVMPETKRLLSRRGSTFTNYIATTSQCCPSRASLLTGQYAHNHGVTSNQVGYPGLIDKANVLPVWLRRAGYRTMHVGSKYINGYEGFVQPSSKVAPGWSQWFTSVSATRYYNYVLSDNGRQRYRGSDPDDYIGRVLADRATKLVDDYAPKRRPFYLQIDERAPHGTRQEDPYGDCGHGPIPDRRDENLFGEALLPASRSFDERDMSDKPRFLRLAPRLTPHDEALILRRWRCALASLTSVDRTVREVVGAVRQSGEQSNTVFIYVSDNGLFYGEHRIQRGKVFPYEEALRLPLIIKLPGRYRDWAEPAHEIQRVVGNIDLAPTILDLAGGEPCTPSGDCRTMDGRSLMPLLRRSGDWPNRSGLLTEYREPDLPHYSTCEFAGIRTRNEIYVEHYRVADATGGACVDQSPPDVERYDLRSDPFELDNDCFGGLAANCPVGAKQNELDRRLQKLRRCAGVKGRDQRIDGRPFCG